MRTKQRYLQASKAKKTFFENTLGGNIPVVRERGPEGGYKYIGSKGGFIT